MHRRQRDKVVLVVEDDPHLRELYRSTLILAGCAVVAVEDGVDALRWMEVATPHAVVLDLGLPRLSGLDLEQELSSHIDTKRIPIVVVTGSDTTDLDESKFACVLRKPVKPEALVAAVADCLRGR